MKKPFVLAAAGIAVGATVILTRCGGGTSDTNALAIAAPAIAVTSPTAGSTSRRGNAANRDEDTEDPDHKPFEEASQELKDAFTKNPIDVVAGLKFGEVKSRRAPCFGPEWTDDAARGGRILRPVGDLGMVYITRDDISTEACAAAQMNSLIGRQPKELNNVQKLIAAALRKADMEGKDLPAIGASTTLDMPTVEGLTFTEAGIERLADDADGYAVYRTKLVGTKDSKTFKIVVHHTPLNADNTEFKGIMQAIMPHNNPSVTGALRGFSAIYSQKDGASTLLVESVANRTTASPDFFDTTTGRVKFTGTAAGEDFNRMIAEFKKATHRSDGAATVHYAWQAGAGDGATRVFGVTVDGRTEGSTGVGYFGFGAAADVLPDSTSTFWATKMHCDWLDGAKPSIPKVQKQTMAFTSGEFRQTGSSITFAPTDDCNDLSGWTVSGAGFLNGARGATTNDLVNPPTDFPAVTAPTYTLPTR